MFSEKISNEYIVTQQGTSEGTQIKYKKGNYWYKKDHRGHEGMAEYLVWQRNSSRYKKGIRVAQHTGMVKGKRGTRVPD